jgi:hypothetical protein
LASAEILLAVRRDGPLVIVEADPDPGAYRSALASAVELIIGCRDFPDGLQTEAARFAAILRWGER